MGSSRDHWPVHARQWAQIGPPLRPAAEDLAICERTVAAWAERAGRAPRALLLGVTPEIATMRWPIGTRLVAADRSAAMVDAVFPAAAGQAITADWRSLPFPDAAFDWIVGDGSASVFTFPGEYAQLAAELVRLLAPDGELVLRVYALPEQPESLADVARDLAANAIGNFHILKWRIAMAIQPPDRNVFVADIWRAFESMVPDRAALARATGWSEPAIATIDAYRGSDIAYSFPTVAEAVGALRGFAEIARHVPRYELGDRCPTLQLRAEHAQRGE